MTDLDKIAQKWGTDKSSLSHGYTEQYERYLGPYRDLNRGGSLLELGWGGHEDPDAGGASARMWREWLPRPNWRITIVDNEEKNLVPGRDNGIALLRADQTDPMILEHAPFDIIIDDASHLSSLTIKSFELLWPALKPGGWYVVEDTHMAYHSFYYGINEANPDPSAGVDALRHADETVTAMGFLKRLADQANYRGRGGWDLFPPEYDLGFDVEEVHFHFNIAFVKKRG